MRQFLITEIMKARQDIPLHMEKLDKATGTMRMTEYLNLEYEIGRYHAYLNCMEELDIEKFSYLHTLCQPVIDKALEKLEGIYK